MIGNQLAKSGLGNYVKCTDLDENELADREWGEENKLFILIFSRANGSPNGQAGASVFEPHPMGFWREVLARITSLELLSRTVVEGFISGLHRSPYTGFSTEFAEHRQYMPGDDLRYLDWKLLGRTDRYYIKKYRADTNSQCHILIDASASMRYTTTGVTKLQYAQFLGVAAGLSGQQAAGRGRTDRLRPRNPHARPRAQPHRAYADVFGRLEQLEAGNETKLSGYVAPGGRAHHAAASSWSSPISTTTPKRSSRRSNT